MNRTYLHRVPHHEKRKSRFIATILPIGQETVVSLKLPGGQSREAPTSHINRDRPRTSRSDQSTVRAAPENSQRFIPPHKLGHTAKE